MPAGRWPKSVDDGVSELLYKEGKKQESDQF
jgi:hypothetical protein